MDLHELRLGLNAASNWSYGLGQAARPAGPSRSSPQPGKCNGPEPPTYPQPIRHFVRLLRQTNSLERPGARARKTPCRARVFFLGFSAVGTAASLYYNPELSPRASGPFNDRFGPRQDSATAKPRSRTFHLPPSLQPPSRALSAPKQRVPIRDRRRAGEPSRAHRTIWPQVERFSRLNQSRSERFSLAAVFRRQFPTPRTPQGFHELVQSGLRSPPYYAALTRSVLVSTVRPRGNSPESWALLRPRLFPDGQGNLIIRTIFRSRRFFPARRIP